MKVCKACDAQFEKGKFCGKCGQPLFDMEETVEQVEDTVAEIVIQEKEEVAEDVVEETTIDEAIIKPQDEEKITTAKEQMKQEVEEVTATIEDHKEPIKKAEKVKKAKKEKKPVKKGRIAILAILTILLLLVGGSLAYLNMSQIDLRVDRDFDEDSYFEQIYAKSFDGEDVSIELPHEGINHYLREMKKGMNVSLPLGVEVSNIVYDKSDSRFVLQLDGGIVHTSVTFDVVAEVVENKVILKYENAKLGKWNLPITLGFINNDMLPEIFSEGVSLPVYMSVSDVNFNRDGVTVIGKVDLAYMKAIIDDYRDALEPSYFAYLKTLDSSVWMVENHVKNYDGSDSSAKSMIYDLGSDMDYLEAALVLVDDAKAEDIIKRVFDGMPESMTKQADTLTEYHHTARKELEDGYPEWYRTEVRSTLLNFFDDTMQAIKDYHPGMGYYSPRIVESHGQAYSLTKGEYMRFSTLEQEVGLVVPYGMGFEMFALGNELAIGVALENEYLVTYDGYNIYEYANKDEFMDIIGFRKAEENEPTFLHRGNATRADIAAVVSDYIDSDNSIFIRYLAFDGQYAFIIASPGDYPQDVYQYLLHEESGKWVVKESYSEYSTISSRLTSYMNKDDFNVRILPPYEISDFYVWWYSSSKVTELKEHLEYKGEVTSSDDVLYLSRVEDMLVVSFDSGKRFVFDFVDGSSTSYDAYYVLEEGKVMQDYFYLLSDEDRYEYYIPGFVFLQD